MLAGFYLGEENMQKVKHGCGVVFLILYVIEDMRKILIFSMHTVRVAID